jgi:hypothetical protein
LFGKVDKIFAKMWHEARKQEKKIKGLMVDYRKRADRRKDYYEKIVSYSLIKDIQHN